MTPTDWTAAPEWAEYLSKDDDGTRIWWETRPFLSATYAGRWSKATALVCHQQTTPGPNDGIMTLERRP